MSKKGYKESTDPTNSKLKKKVTYKSLNPLNKKPENQKAPSATPLSEDAQQNVTSIPVQELTPPERKELLKEKFLKTRPKSMETQSIAEPENPPTQRPRAKTFSEGSAYDK